MNFAYYEINDLKHTTTNNNNNNNNNTANGGCVCKLYYKKPIDIEERQATEFGPKYMYFYINPHTGQKRQLGRFMQMGIRMSGRVEDDYDYSVYEFTDDYIPETNKASIYCIGIPESEREVDMVRVEGLTFGIYPVFYSQELHKKI